MERKKAIIILVFVIFLAGCAMLPQAEFLCSCNQKVLAAGLKRIRSPQNAPIKDFHFSLDNKKAIFLISVFGKTLTQWNFKEEYWRNAHKPYSLDNIYFPLPSQSVGLDEEEANKIRQEWLEMARKEEGVTIKEHMAGFTKKITIEKEEYWIYSLENSKWSKLSLAEGKALYKDWSRRKYVGRNSPDGRIYIFKRIYAQRQSWLDRMFPMAGVPDIYGLGIKCVNEEGERFFKTNSGGGFNNKWSSDGEYILVIDRQGYSHFNLIHIKTPRICSESHHMQ